MEEIACAKHLNFLFPWQHPTAEEAFRHTDSMQLTQDSPSGTIPEVDMKLLRMLVGRSLVNSSNCLFIKGSFQELTLSHRSQLESPSQRAAPEDGQWAPQSVMKEHPPFTSVSPLAALHFEEEAKP